MSTVMCGNWQYVGPNTPESWAEAERMYPVGVDFPNGGEARFFGDEEPGIDDPGCYEPLGVYARHLAFDDRDLAKYLA